MRATPLALILFWSTCHPGCGFLLQRGFHSQDIRADLSPPTPIQPHCLWPCPSSPSQPLSPEYPFKSLASAWPHAPRGSPSPPHPWSTDWLARCLSGLASYCPLLEAHTGLQPLPAPLLQLRLVPLPEPSTFSHLQGSPHLCPQALP